MDDLISRAEVIDAIDALDWYHLEHGEMVQGAKGETQAWYKAEDAYKALEGVPSAEPEIIRCKDCLIHGVCRFEQGLGLDGYCSQAERRTD